MSYVINAIFTLVLLGALAEVLEEHAEARHAAVAAEFAVLRNLCGPMIITTYERGESTITMPDGSVQ